MAKKNKQARLEEMAVRKQQTQPEPSVELAPEEQVVPAVLAVPVVAATKVVVPKVDFDAWFAMRGSKIPKTHHKEVIKADFKGRGFGQYESLEDFDKALKQYGINLD